MFNGHGPHHKGTLIPDRWLHCPRKSDEIIFSKFLAFKTPLSSNYDTQVPENCRFTINMIMDSLRGQGLKLGLWIDLTNTSRFYNHRDVERYLAKYCKMACKGHGETPDEDQTQRFIETCREFFEQHPDEIIGVHCTHGFNRTGFLIISYLVQVEGFDLDDAINVFANCRYPGIYKADYLEELYRRYGDVEDTRSPPPRPEWCQDPHELAESNKRKAAAASQDQAAEPSRKRRREFKRKNPQFMEGVPGVTGVMDDQTIKRVQTRCQELCKWPKTGFPGSQPVSMDMDNVWFLHEKPYRVSWKADGTRYMMFIQGDGQIYFIDRDNSVFQVQGLNFYDPQNSNKRLSETLLDGEMVIDKDGGMEYPRYLAYDVIACNGRDVSYKVFFPDRYKIIRDEVIGGRRRAEQSGKFNKNRESFSVRHKEFWEITQTEYLIGEKFAKKLSHEPDGLIFQPADQPYEPGPCKEILKWKPSSLNSVDFRLKIEVEKGMGILTKSVGLLYVGGMDQPFDRIKVTKQLKEYNNKIIECKVENNSWVFMRERTDKSFPNSVRTAHSVLNSIKNPVTTDILLGYTNKHNGQF